MENKSQERNTPSEQKGFSLVVNGKVVFENGDECTSSIIFGNLSGSNFKPDNKPIWRFNKSPTEDYQDYLKMMRHHFTHEFPVGAPVAVIDHKGVIVHESTIGGLAPSVE